MPARPRESLSRPWPVTGVTERRHCPSPSVLPLDALEKLPMIGRLPFDTTAQPTFGERREAGGLRRAPELAPSRGSIGHGCAPAHDASPQFAPGYPESTLAAAHRGRSAGFVNHAQSAFHRAQTRCPCSLTKPCRASSSTRSAPTPPESSPSCGQAFDSSSLPDDSVATKMFSPIVPLLGER